MAAWDWPCSNSSKTLGLTCDPQTRQFSPIWWRSRATWIIVEDFFCKRQILLQIRPYKLFGVQQTKLIIAPVPNVLTVSVVVSKKFITLEPSPPGPKSPKNFFYGPPKRRDQSFATQQLVSSWIWSDLAEADAGGGSPKWYPAIGRFHPSVTKAPTSNSQLKWRHSNFRPQMFASNEILFCCLFFDQWTN